MPNVELILYKEGGETVPLVTWLDSLRLKPRQKCLNKIERLRDLGYELRRPEADYLRDGIYELRTRIGTVNYRILYFFFGSMAVVISHGIAKEDRVPRREIERALERKIRFEQDPAAHSHLWERA